MSVISSCIISAFDRKKISQLHSMISRVCRGPVYDKWLKLNLLPDPTQLRAVSLLDEFAESKLVHHKSSTSHIPGPQFDLSIFHYKETSTDESHEKVANYTRSMAEQNKRLLEAQKRRKERLFEKQPVISHTTYASTTSSSSVPSSPSTPSSTPLSTTTITPSCTTSSSIPMVPSVYLFGSVGRGKTLLLNILHDCLPPSIRSSRYHFFELMKRVHAEMAAGKRVVDFANEIADNTDVLFLDELAIMDIQDATIFPILSNVLVRRKVALIMTSNQHPQSLYTNGLNRHIYLPPFLQILRQSNCRLVSLDNDQGEQIDYRSFGGPTSAADETRVWQWTVVETVPSIPQSNFRLSLSPTRNMDLATISRGFAVSASYLTNDQFSDSDYVKLADFMVEEKFLLQIFVESKFSPADIFGPARRFGKLVEILYDKKVNVEFVSPIHVKNLFEISQVEDFVTQGLIGENLNSVASPLAVSSVHEGFRSIERCVSRLAQAAKLS